jgi:mRNA interferase RelE/StbE
LVWRIEFDAAAKKDLAKLDQPVAKRIVSFLRDRIAPAEDPRAIGEALRGSKLGEFWKYRVGAYRIICAIEDGAFRVLVVRLGNRHEVYR